MKNRLTSNLFPDNKLSFRSRTFIIAVAFLAVLLTAAIFILVRHLSSAPVYSESSTVHFVVAQAETTPVPRAVIDDSADDPAIWVHHFSTDSSRIIGTDKKGGLAVYDLAGKELYYYPDGNMNNADLRYNFLSGSDTIDVLAVSNRTNNTLSLYRINRNGSLAKIGKRQFKTELADEVYGLCMYKSNVTGKFYVFMNNKFGEVEQWEIFAQEDGVDGRIVRKLKLASQVEGMVADDENSALFVGEERTGIWRFNAEPDSSVEGILLTESSEKTNSNIKFDIEGMAIYSLPDKRGYLIASSQGNDSYAVYDRQTPYKYLGSIHIVDGVVDGSQGTDGLDVTSIPLGAAFPYGLLVVQDGSNKNGVEPAAQNFKLVSWKSIAEKFSPPLEIQ
jgi:3-phytase